MYYHKGDVLPKAIVMPKRIPIFLLACALLSGATFADDFIIDGENSIFAVITHKAGIIARLAHNHLIYAQDYDADLTIDGDDISTASFRNEFPVENLVVSDV